MQMQVILYGISREAVEPHLSLYETENITFEYIEIATDKGLRMKVAKFNRSSTTLMYIFTPEVASMVKGVKAENLYLMSLPLDEDVLDSNICTALGCESKRGLIEEVLQPPSITAGVVEEDEEEEGVILLQPLSEPQENKVNDEEDGVIVEDVPISLSFEEGSFEDLLENPFEGLVENPFEGLVENPFEGLVADGFETSCQNLHELGTETIQSIEEDMLEESILEDDVLDEDILEEDMLDDDDVLEVNSECTLGSAMTFGILEGLEAKISALKEELNESVSKKVLAHAEQRYLELEREYDKTVDELVKKGTAYTKLENVLLAKTNEQVGLTNELDVLHKANASLQEKLKLQELEADEARKSAEKMKRLNEELSAHVKKYKTEEVRKAVVPNIMLDRTTTAEVHFSITPNATQHMYRQILSGIEKGILVIDLTRSSYIDRYLPISKVKDPKKWLNKQRDITEVYSTCILNKKVYNVITGAAQPLPPDYISTTDWNHVFDSIERVKSNYTKVVIIVGLLESAEMYTYLERLHAYNITKVGYTLDAGVDKRIASVKKRNLQGIGLTEQLIR